MRRRWQLIAMTGVPMFWGSWALGGIIFDSADALGWLGLMLLAIIALLGHVVSYLHRLVYGETTTRPIEDRSNGRPIEHDTSPTQ